MEKNYTVSKETAHYLDAVRTLQQGTSEVLDAAEEVYSDGADNVTAPFREKMNEAIDELFKLIQANIEMNLGFVDNVKKDTVTV